MKFNEYEVKPVHLDRLPIRKASDGLQARFEKEALLILDEVRELNERRQKLLKMLEADYGEVRASERLKEWENLEWADFLKEVGRAKIKLKGKAKDEWYDRFHRMKGEASGLRNLVEERDRQIETMVLEMYGMEEHEKKAVWDYYAEE